MAEQELTVYECPNCWVILPYKSCYHSCLEQDMPDEEGFIDDLTGWYAEVKNKKEQGVKIRVVQADGTIEDKVDRLIVMILPNQSGQQYPEKITGHDIDGSWHLRRNGEDVPQGVEPILMVEVAPGQYKKLSDIEAEEELALQQDQQEEFRPFEELFEEFREPYH